MTRLAYIVTPKPELFAALKIESGAWNEISSPVVIITPLRDYEETFETWHKRWVAKAKHDFVTDFAELWSEEFSVFTEQLRNVDPSEVFDKWWQITKSDLIEIDDKWTPENSRF